MNQECVQATFSFRSYMFLVHIAQSTVLPHFSLAFIKACLLTLLLVQRLFEVTSRFRANAKSLTSKS